MDKIQQGESEFATQVGGDGSAHGLPRLRRKAWKAPRVIVATISESENSGILGGDLVVLS